MRTRIPYQKYKLRIEIETLRDEMIHIGIKEGLTSKRTIKISKRLDQSIIKYQALQQLTRKWRRTLN